MGTFLHYTEAGEGFPLILIHGNGESSEYFSGQTAYFSQTYRVIAPDTRGHGKSPRGCAPFTLEQFAEDLLSFMDELNIEKAHILGFSDGANIALLFALKHPERVKKLVLNGADLSPEGVKPAVQNSIVFGHKLTRFISRYDKKAFAKHEMLGLMVGQPNIKPEELSALSMPVLVIAGTRDMIKDSHTELIARSIPGSELKIMAGTHFIARENPAVFNNLVGDFLEKWSD